MHFFFVDKLFSMKHSHTFTTYKIGFSFKDRFTTVLTGFVKPLMTGDTSFIREPSMHVCTSTYCCDSNILAVWAEKVPPFTKDWQTSYHTSRGSGEALICFDVLVEVSLSFAILHSAIMCLRGTRWSFGQAIREINLTLATAEGQVPPKV